MTDMQTLFQTIDSLSREEIDQLFRYLEQRRRMTWWVIPPENLEAFAEAMRPLQEDAATMPEEEVNALLDEALDEVRRERRANSRRN